MDFSSQSHFMLDSRPESLISVDGHVRLYQHWLPVEEERILYSALLHSLAWQETVIKIYGQEHSIPRLTAWYGDPGCNYRYSRMAFEPLPWTPELHVIRARLQQELGINFNSVLANRYRHGRDSVAWHSDDEPELGANPVIASLSLGTARRFTLKHKVRKDLKPVSVDLPGGSLLVMSGSTQHCWMHQVAKTSKVVGERVNLTFRYIHQ